jgi:hypothetical protein
LNQGKIALFVPLGNYDLKQQFATAIYMASHSNLRPYFLLLTEADHGIIDQLNAADIPFSTIDPVRAKEPRPDMTFSDGNQGQPNIMSRGPFKGFSWCRQLWVKNRLAKRLVRKLAPVCAIISQERHYFYLPVLKAINDLKVPVILIPAADSSPVGCAWLRRENYSLMAGLNNNQEPSGTVGGSPFAITLNRLVNRWMPSQVYHSNWGKMLFYPAAQILLLKTMGMLPQNPWCDGASFTDRIIISGADEETMFAESGIEPGELLFYGNHTLDILYETWLDRTDIRSSFIDKYSLERDKKILIVTLPRLWEQLITSEEEQWKSIREILSVLSGQDYNVVVSLHPSIIGDHYNWIETEYPVKICRESLADILVAADIFVASYSSTIRWAVGLGIPAVNVDLWGFNWKIFRNLTGIKTANNISELDGLLRGFTTAANGSRLNDESRQSGDSNSVIVDGKSKERLLNYIESLDDSAASTVVAFRHTERVS